MRPWLFQQVICTLAIHLEAAQLDYVVVCAVTCSEDEELLNGSGYNSAAAAQTTHFAPI